MEEKQDNKECLHVFMYGYVADLIIYCTKCGKEADDLYGKDIYKTHKLEGGKLVELDT